MQFASPLWLIGLIPWAALALWLLFRRRKPTDVPFLPLWMHTFARPATQPRISAPPLSLLLLLLAIGCSVLGAAEPRWKGAIKQRAAVAPSQAAITLLSAVNRPKPRVLVQVTTAHFDRSTISLSVISGDQRVVQMIEVAPDGVKNIFLDLTRFNEKVSATLGDSAGLTIERKGKPIDLAADAHAPPPLRRLVALIEQQRRPTDEKPSTIAVDSSLAPDRTGIVLAPPTSAARADWTVMDDPLTREVDWSELSGGCSVDPTWEPLVFSGDRVLIARRRQLPLQILASVATTDWASRPSFVVFWTDAIDALAGGDGEFDRYQTRLVEVPPSSEISTQHDLSPGLFLVALLMLGLAGGFVPKRSIPYTAGHVESNANEAAHPHR